MSRLRFALWACIALAAGCTPSIGDQCTQSTDCSQLGDRLCDPTQPEGYCTIFNCEPDTCPPDSICVGFDFQLDPACGAADDGKFARFERTFCMKPCESTSDCRDGYVCVRPCNGDKECEKNAAQQAKVAHIVDENTVGSADSISQEKVCMADTTLPTAPVPSSTPGVCEPADAGPPWTPFDGGVGGSGGSP